LEFLSDYFLIFYMLTISGTAICGAGLFVMGKSVQFKKLLFLGLGSAFLMSPIWLLDISNGAKVYLTTLLLVVLLNSTQKLGWFVSTGAALSGLALLTVIEFCFTFFLQFNPSWLIRILHASPPTLFGLTLAIIGQSWLEKTPGENWFADVEKIEDSDWERALKIVPLGQLFNAFILIAVTVSIISWPVFNRFLPLILTGFILFSLYLTKKYFFPRDLTPTPIDFVDLVIMIPVVFYIINATGGAESPWKVFFLLLVITNALKKYILFGLLSIFFSGGILFFYGIRELMGQGSWFWQLDILCFAALILIFTLIRFFIFSEKALKEEVKNTRRNILSSISHDLRTPMTLVQGYTEVLLQEEIIESSKKSYYLELILEKARDLKRFARNLLELAKLETGKMPLQKENISSREYVEGIEKSYRLIAEKKELELKAMVEEDFHFEADRYLLDRVLANLLFNALAYTPPGGSIILTGSRIKDGNEVLFSVRDTGKGIREDELSRIFLRFYRGSEQKRSKGKGLGLPIAREIVELHGGRIWVESRKGEGTTCFFVIPIKAKAQKPAGFFRRERKPLLKPIPLAQLFSFVFVIFAFFASGLDLFPPGFSQPFFAFSIGAIIFSGVVPLILKSNSTGLRASNIGLIFDLPILVIMIFMILASTGYSTSPWKLLFAPLIITNSLKKGTVIGPLSVALASGSLLIMGIIDSLRGMDWFIEQDLAYITIFALIFGVTGHLKRAQETQKTELAESGSHFLVYMAHYLQVPLEEIINTMESLMKKIKEGKKDFRPALLQVQQQVLQLNRFIENAFEIIQFEAGRAVLQAVPISLDELIEKSLKRARTEKKFTPVEISYFCQGRASSSASFPLLFVDKERFSRALASFLFIPLLADSWNFKNKINCTILNKGDEITFEIKGVKRIEGNTWKEKIKMNNLFRMELMIIEQIIKLHKGFILIEELPGSDEIVISLTIPVKFPSQKH